MSAPNEIELIAATLRLAVTTRDPDALCSVLADDVRWGDDGFPRSCRSRADVLRTLSEGMTRGLEADLGEVVAGQDGVLVGLRVRQPDDPPDALGRTLFQVYLVRDGLVSEIRPFDERPAAAAAAGVA